jgi:asparagine synthase (glutamine-hydrolysing)
MTHALAHRGPDGHSEFVDDALRVHLGHRRLAVIDVETGQQPMWNEHGDVCVVFNGEIYNHAELRTELERRGHRFASDHSDTEVLVHGWEEWEEELPLRLNGMFAFAVFDRRRRRLFLARDRMGEKPLYYTARPDLFAFASELTALATHRSVEADIDPRSVHKLLAYGYLPAPNALFRRCAKLPAGHFLTLDLSTGRSATRCYWEFRIEPDEALTPADEPRLIEELRSLLGEAVRRRLASDVPLGIFLSGGLDSSACLLMAAAHRPAQTIETFTIGFNEPTFDEAPYAREVAGFFGTRHREQYLDLASARDFIRPVLDALDEPIGANGSFRGSLTAA